MDNHTPEEETRTMSVDDGGPAFGQVVELRCVRVDPFGGEEWEPALAQGGMSLRDYFAAKAMQGLIGDGALRDAANRVCSLAALAYQQADAMLEMRKVGWLEMATLEQLAQKLREANKENKPMGLQWMAEQWWPDAEWLRIKAAHHNGGARVGARVAGGIAGRMERAGLLILCDVDGPRAYKLLAEKNHDR